MVMFKVKESKFGAPAGIYVGEFLGIQPMKDDGKPRLNRDGKPMEPGVEWQFKITEGEQAGQIVGRITSLEPTTKNACGTLLSGLVGHVVRADEQIDPAGYVGRRYQIVIGHSKESPEKTYVTQIHAVAGGGASAPPSAPPAPTGPRPPAAPPPTPAPSRRTGTCGATGCRPRPASRRS
jgi:hypothetical protein